MGCCFSKATTQNQQPHHLRSPAPTHELDTRAPPPTLEEESVKEVLSETPISKPHQVPILTAETKTQLPVVQNPDENLETKEVSEAVVVSQLSETCSMSESFSTATTATITEKKEEDEATSKRSNTEGTTIHKWNHRSPSHASSRNRPYAVASGRERRLKSPARRPEPSPEKKARGGSRSVRGRESGPGPNRRLNAGVRRDPGEGSGRRSRSPSCARTVGSVSKVGVGGGREQVPPEKGGSEEEVEEKNDVVSQEDSIENPHVSMECFIFL